MSHRCRRTILHRLVLATAAFAVLPAVAQEPPEETVKSFQAADGLEATLFAAEPMLMKPANIDVDAMGRVWVCEGVDYRAYAHLRPEGDRILVLEDSAGKGKADKATIFYQGKELACPLGVCVLGNRVIVSNSPNVFALTDTHNSGKADQKVTLFTGIQGVQHDHGVHAFSFGPDGKLYFNMGNESKDLKRPDGSFVKDVFGNTVEANKPGTKAGTTDKVAYRQGMVMRCNLDGSDVEVLANNFRNNYEVAVDAFGTLWQSDNDDDGNRAVRINYVMEYGNYGFTDEVSGAGWQSRRTNWEKEIPLRHWHQNDPGVIPNLLQTGQGAPTGICVYEGTLLPEIFRNQVIHCESSANVVRSYPVSPSGAGYSATIADLLSNTADRWFRPSDVCVAPDGSLMVSDWYDPVVGGHGMGDNKYPHMHGRIYRIAPRGSPYKMPALDTATPDGAAAALVSPNMARRYLGWTALHDMGDKAEPALLKLWQSADARHRARALFLLATLSDGKPAKYVNEAIHDKNPDIRITALRVARSVKMDVIPLVTELAHDPSPQVRRECAIALHYNRSAKMPALWAELASQHDGKDRWYVEALGIGAADRDAECLDAYLAKVGDAWNGTPGHDVIWRSRAPKAATYLAKIILDPAIGDDERPRYIRALDFIPASDAKLDALLAMLNSTLPDKSIQLEAVGRLQGIKSPKVPPLEPVVAKILDAKRGTPEFVELCDQTDVRNRDGELLAYAAAHNGETAGVQAARIVMRHNDQKAIKAAMTGPDAVKVVTAFGNIADGSARPLLAGIVADKTNPLPVRSTAVKTLARSHTGGHILIELARKRALADDLAFVLSNELRAHNSKDIREEADKLFPAPAGKDAKPLPPVAELVKMKGDATHGHALWVDTCSKCHQVGSEGVDFGPNLTEIGSKLPKEALSESILAPSAAIEFGYEGHVVKLKNGDEVEGLIPSQTADEITVKTAGVGGAILTKYKRADIAQIRDSKLSIMPEGLQTNLSAQDFADLLEYLASLKKK